MNSIITASDGAVGTASQFGVFRSADRGAAWEHLPGAFGGGQLSGPVMNGGPILIEHPVPGLAAFANRSNPATATAPSIVADEIWLRRSREPCSARPARRSPYGGRPGH